MTSRINKSISELSDAEERFRSITKSSSAVIIIAADQQGKIISWNPGAAAAFGYSESEMLGQLVIDLVPERYKSAHTEGFQRAIHSEEYRILGKTVELQALRKGGEEFPVELSLGTWKQGAHRYFSAIMHDVTARNQTEAALRRTQKMEAIGELTGGLAHDFNNLLGIIIGNLDLMGRKIEDGSKLQKQLGKAQNAALRGSELTRRLLNFSKTAPEENSPLDINKVIGNLEDLIGKSLTAEVQIETALDSGLWMVEINPGDLEDAIVNLALNARDAMPNGGQLVLETRNTVLDDTVGDLGDGLEPGEYVEIAVSDNGHGMPREVSDKIFEPFFTTKEQDKGTGLGLAMVYGFVRRAKGYISVYSEVNVGTTFRLYLPRSRSMSEQTEIPVDADAPLPTGTETVLIVDDEHDLAEAAKSILDGLGYSTICAHNGDEALKILDKDRSIDLLFSDVVMAGSINGFSLADTAIIMKPELKVLMTSGFTGKMQHDGDTERWRKTLIAKPYRYTDLAIRVRAVLDGRA